MPRRDQFDSVMSSLLVPCSVIESDGTGKVSPRSLGIIIPALGIYMTAYVSQRLTLVSSLAYTSQLPVRRDRVIHAE